MKVEIVRGPHFKSNLNKCYDYMVKTYSQKYMVSTKKEA